VDVLARLAPKLKSTPGRQLPTPSPSVTSQVEKARRPGPNMATRVRQPMAARGAQDLCTAHHLRRKERVAADDAGAGEQGEAEGDHNVLHKLDAGCQRTRPVDSAQRTAHSAQRHRRAKEQGAEGEPASATTAAVQRRSMTPPIMYAISQPFRFGYAWLRCASKPLHHAGVVIRFNRRDSSTRACACSRSKPCSAASQPRRNAWRMCHPL
jgi:hypothetical protein